MIRQKLPNELKEKIHFCLQLNCRGRHRTLRAIDLANKFGIDIRMVNDIIRSLRLQGILIGSAKERPYGYYLPVTEQEIKDYLHTYRSELFDMLQVHNIQKRAARKTLENLKQPEFSIVRDQLAFIT